MPSPDHKSEVTLDFQYIGELHMAKPRFKKSRDYTKPYAIYRDDRYGWEWRVLKAYSSAEGEDRNPRSRWFCATSSPITRDQTATGFELGDIYAVEVHTNGRLVAATAEWLDEYPSHNSGDVAHLN